MQPTVTLVVVPVKQNRLKSVIAGAGTVITILGGVFIALQNNGTIPQATNSSSRTITVIVTIIGMIVNIYSHYNNPTNKAGF